jgi:predicted nucleic acid-binding protein
MVGLDASVLILFLNPDAKAPTDPSTDLPVDQAHARVNHLIKQLEANGSQIVIPTPALSEVLVRTGRSGLNYVSILEERLAFVIKPFDTIAAIELAEITRRAIEGGDKNEGSREPYQKIKVDRQIVAICKLNGVQTLYSADKSLRNFAERAGMNAIAVHQMELPPTQPPPPQLDFLRDVDNPDKDE